VCSKPFLGQGQPGPRLRFRYAPTAIKAARIKSAMIHADENQPVTLRMIGPTPSLN
jgi:hypothetical protein